LKDAAATAIYGNRASNGVFIVTTRRGKKGQFQVGYSGYVGTEKVSSQLKMMDATQLRTFLSANGQGFTPADDKGANTNWQKAIERNSAVSNGHNLFVSGGSEHGNYSGSLTYINKEGILQKSNLSRVIGRLSLEEYALDDKVKFGLNVTNANSNADDIPYRNTVLLESNLYLPVSPVKNADGTYFENLTKSGYYNPVAMMNNSQMNTKTNNLMGNFTTQVKLPFGLSYDLNLAYMNTTTLSGYYLNSYFTSKYNNMYDNPDPNTYGHVQQTFGTNGQANRASYQNSSKIVETYLTWDKAFGKHSVNAVVGYSWQENVSGDGFQATTYNFPVNNIGFLNFALSNPYAYSTQINFGADLVYQKVRLISDFGRLKYNYDEKYYLQASLRRDGSSAFGANHHWGYFPSVSAAWRITQEDFMKDQNIFNELKLRASYGVTGNSFGFNAYTAQLLMGNLGSYYYNGVLTSAYGPLAAANPDLKWEEIATTNIGVDFAMLKGRLNASLDFYNKKTTGMIYKYAADPILIPIGGSIVANGGSIENKGVELVVTANVVSKRDLSWTSTLNLAHNDNKILSLKNPLFSGGDSVGVGYPEGGAGLSGTTLELLKSGHPLGQFFTPVYAGKAANSKSQWIKSGGKPDTSLPSVGKDYQYAGSAQPKLLLGFSNTFRYKNLDLNVFIRGVFGNKIFNATKAALFTPSTAQFTNLPVAAAGESAKDVYDYVYSTRFIESGSYLRFDNATLGYNFRNAGKYVKALRVYATVNNLFVITSFTGVDPEVNQGGIAPGIDYNNFYPRTRTFLLGANVSF